MFILGYLKFELTTMIDIFYIKGKGLSDNNTCICDMSLILTIFIMTIV